MQDRNQHLVPEDLWAFLTSFRAPAEDKGSFLGSFDQLMNDGAPEVSEVRRNVPIREVDGWQLRCDLYVPHGEMRHPALLYLHGGGWVHGNPWTHRRLAAELALAGVMIVSVDYRRAPKHRFPAAFDDARTALEWVFDNADVLEVREDRVGIGGDSAGAHLAAGLLATRRSDATPVRAALLISGVFDYHAAEHVLFEREEGGELATQQYVDPSIYDDLRGDIRLAPVAAAARFPPTMIVTGTQDPLHVQSLDLAEALTSKRVPMELLDIEGAPHSYLQLPCLPYYDSAISAVRRFLCRYLVSDHDI